MYIFLLALLGCTTRRSTLLRGRWLDVPCPPTSHPDNRSKGTVDPERPTLLDARSTEKAVYFLLFFTGRVSCVVVAVVFLALHQKRGKGKMSTNRPPLELLEATA